MGDNYRDASFPKANRLLKKSDFDRVFAARKSAAAGPIVVYVAKNDVGVPRLGLVVSRKVGTAVARNRWKRRLREAFRLEKQNLPQDVDVVVLPRTAEAEEVDRLRTALVRTVHRLVGSVSNPS
jgi:ribonuclease P protein component